MAEATKTIVKTSFGQKSAPKGVCTKGGGIVVAIPYAITENKHLVLVLLLKKKYPLPNH
jgi:hypothetical protein